MIVFLYGQDSYRINQKLQELINGYKAKNPSGLNFFSYDFSDGSFRELKEKLTNTSLIPEKKLVVLKNIFKKNSEEILKTFKSQNIQKREDVIVIVIFFNDSDSSELFRYLSKKPNQVQSFKLLKEYEVKNWAKNFVGYLNIDLTGEALDFLISNCGNDLWIVDSEIRKLANFSHQDGRVNRVINKSQVEELVISNANGNIFELTDALAKKNKKKALTAFYKILENGAPPSELLGILAWQVRNILTLKVSPESLRAHPFVLAKIKESAGLFSTDELNKILLKIIDLDLASKTTQLNEKTAISLLISEL